LTGFLAAVLKGVDGLGFGEFEDNQIDLFGDAYEFLPKPSPSTPFNTAAKRKFLSLTVFPKRLLVVSKSANRPLMSTSDG
jgi:hypothetical protein